MNSNGRRGAARERKVKALLESQGYYVTKAGGSLGVADLVALRLGSPPLMVQVKSDQRSPWTHFGPADRQELRVTAAGAGATAVVAWWPPRQREPKMLGVEDWPGSITS